MRKKGMLKRVLAVCLAAALALTGPASSLACVQAAEVQEDAQAAETESTQDASVQEAEAAETAVETADGTETEEAVEAASGEAAEAQTTEAVTQEENEEADEMALEEQANGETTQAVVEETVKTVEEEDAEETAVEDEDLTTKYGAPLLTLGTNEGYILKESDDVRRFAFTAEESGLYKITASVTDVCFDMDLENENDVLFGDYLEDNSQEITFWATSGETKYIKIRVYDEDWEAIAPTTTADAVFVLEKVEVNTGTVASNADTGYTFSGGDVSMDLEVSPSYSYVELKSTLRTNITGMYLFRDGSREHLGSGIAGDTRTTKLDGLDAGMDYHFRYLLWYWDEEKEDDVFYYFDGTGEPFDVSTRSTDKEGGIITGITADNSSFTVAYELFDDTITLYGQYDAYIRYRKNEDGAEWSYYYVDGYGNAIIAASSSTAYLVELISYDKETVYDSASITTKAGTDNENTITVAVDEAAVTADTAQIVISGYEGSRSLVVYVDYTDSYGTNYGKDDTYISNSNAISGNASVTLNDLEAATEYQDITVTVREGYKNAPVLYNGALSFTTKAASFDQTNLNISFTENGSNAVDMTTEIVDLSETVTGTFQYRIKEEGASWSGKRSLTLSADSNSFLNSLTSLSAAAEYELEYNIGGITGSTAFKTAAADVLPKAAVTKTYANGLELAFSLEGEADSADLYEARVYVYETDCWYYAGRITLDGAETVTQDFSSDGVIPGQTQKWEYIVYKNNKTYYTGYFEAATNPLSLDITSAAGTPRRIVLECTASNADVIAGGTFAHVIWYRKKGTTAWIELRYSSSIYPYKDGSGWKLRFNADEEDLPFAPGEYEIRIVSAADESVVYGTTDCTVVESDWEFSLDDEKQVTFLYDMIETPCIGIKHNYEKPTVEVQDESIVTVKKATTTKIYLDLHNIGTTKLTVTAGGMTKELMVTVSAASELYFLEGADKTLADIPLPEKYSWVDPTISPTADDENEIQYFAVKFMEDGEEKSGNVPVSVSRLDAISIVGKDTIGAVKSGVYSVYYAGTGYLVTDGGAYKITQKWSTSDANLVIEGRDNDTNVTITSGSTAGTYALTVDVTIENVRSKKTYQTTQEQQIRIIGEGLIDNLYIKPAENQPTDAVPYTASGSIVNTNIVSGSVVSGAIIVIDCDDYDKDTKSKLQLEASTFTGTELVDADVSWSSEDESILEVTDAGLVTVKSGGTASIDATTKDGGEYTEPVVFKILDYAPLFETTSLTVIAGSSEGTKLAYTEQNDNSVEDITIKDNASQLEIEKREDGWYIRVKDGNTYNTNTTEDITLIVSTKKRDYEHSLKILVNTGSPDDNSGNEGGSGDTSEGEGGDTNEGGSGDTNEGEGGDTSEGEGGDTSEGEGGDNSENGDNSGNTDDTSAGSSSGSNTVDGDYYGYTEEERTDISSGTITGIKAKVYDGSAYEPIIKVTVPVNGKNTTLTEGADYGVSFTSNVNSGTATVTVKGNGKYKGTLTKEFEISKKSVKKLKIITGSASVGDTTLPIYVYDGTKLLTSGTDYTLSDAGSITAVAASSVKVKVTGKGNYTDEVTTKLTVYESGTSIINPEDVSLELEALDYTGKALKPAVTVKVGDKTLTTRQYKVQYQNNKNAGTAYVIVTGKGDYKGKVVKSFTINAVKEKLTVTVPNKTYTYNGKLQKPNVSVKSNGKKLSKNKDYTVAYANNLHAGTATVTVTGKGNYADLIGQTEFTISPQAIKKASVKGTKDNLTLAYGKQNLKEGKDYTLTYGEVKNKKVEVTISGLGDFKETVTKKVKNNL